MKPIVSKSLMLMLYSIGTLLLLWNVFIFVYQYIAAIHLSHQVVQAFGNARILSALYLSITSAFVTALLAVMFGVPLAYIFATKDFPGKTIIENLTIDVPQTFPPIAEGIIFILMLGPDSPFHVNLAYTFTALVLAKLFVSAPFVIALSARKFSEIKASGLDTIAQSLGAHPFQIFSTLYVPMSFKDIIGGTALCWARAIGELGGSLLFAGVIPFKTEIVPTYIAKMGTTEIVGAANAAVEGGSVDIASALAATILVTSASIIALLFFKLITPGGAIWKVLFYKV